MDAALGIGALFDDVARRAGQLVEASRVRDEGPDRLGRTGEVLVPWRKQAELIWIARFSRSFPSAADRPGRQLPVHYTGERGYGFVISLAPCVCPYPPGLRERPLRTRKANEKGLKPKPWVKTSAWRPGAARSSPIT